MDNLQTITDKLIGIDKVIIKARNKEAEIKTKNMEACGDILKELGYQVTDWTTLFLFYVGNTIPVGSLLLDRVRDTATEHELNVLRKHGIKL